MEAYQARVESFTKPRRIKNPSKSSSSSSVKWPHPSSFSATPETLAEAGFYYSPAWEDRDNVVCFMCGKEISAWEESDDPFDIHWTKCRSCPWAIVRCSLKDDLVDDDFVFKDANRLPTSKFLEKARLGTFIAEKRWPHDADKHHGANSKKMANAGFVYTPQQAGDDTATCLYCELALSGWDAEDDPMQEHQKRKDKNKRLNRSCPFFSASLTGATIPNSKASGSRPPVSKVPSKASSRSRGAMTEPAHGSRSGSEDELATAAPSDVEPPRSGKSRAKKTPASLTVTRSATSALSSLPTSGRSRRGGAALNGDGEAEAANEKGKHVSKSTKGKIVERSRKVNEEYVDVVVDVESEKEETRGRAPGKAKAKDGGKTSRGKSTGKAKGRSRSRAMTQEETDKDDEMVAMQPKTTQTKRAVTQTDNPIAGKKRAKSTHTPPPVDPDDEAPPPPPPVPSISMHPLLEAKRKSLKRQEVARSVSPRPALDEVAFGAVDVTHLPSQEQPHKILTDDDEDEFEVERSVDIEVPLKEGRKVQRLSTPRPQLRPDRMDAPSSPLESHPEEVIQVPPEYQSSKSKGKGKAPAVSSREVVQLDVDVDPAGTGFFVPTTPPRSVPSVPRHPETSILASEPTSMDAAPSGQDSPAPFLAPLATHSIVNITSLTEEERAMTVEEWIRHEMDVQYEQLKSDGKKRIQMFRDRADEVRRRIEAL